MSTKTSTSASTASESASKRRTKAASSAPAEAVAPVVTAPAPVAPVVAAPEIKGSKRKAPEKETKEPVAKETKRSGAASSKASTAAAPATAATTAAPPATPATEGTSEPPAKKPRKAPAPKAEGEAKSSFKKKKAAAPSSEASPVSAEAPEAKDEEDCADDGNPCIGRYLRALLKREFADSTISKDAIHQVQRYVYQFGLHFLVAVKRHLESAKKNTLMMHDMPTCLQRSLSRSSLYQDFSNAMTAALTLYYASYQNAEQSSGAPATAAADTAADASIEEKRKQMWAARAGLSIPPTRTKEFAKKYLAKFRFSQNSITGLTALFEVLAQRIFKLSYEKAQEVSRKRISQLDVQTALKGDNELSWLLIEPVVPLV